MRIIKEDRYFQYGLQRPIKYYVLKRCIYPIANLFFHVVVWGIYKFRSPRRHKYYLSVVLIFKDEAPFLKEWLEFHLMLGVEHFYLYQNNSTDNYREVLSAYIEKGLVTFVNWPEYPGQYSAYRDWYVRFRSETFWVTFIDADEFLCPLRETSLPRLLSQYERFPVILAYWKLFGTSGRLHHDYEKPVIEQYVHCRPKLYTEGKMFYNTQFDIADSLISMHGVNVKWGKILIPPANSYGKFILWGFHRANRSNDAHIQINHYWSKSYDCWEKKYEKGSIEKGTKWKDLSFFEQLEVECTSCDYTIYRFLIQLKRILYKGGCATKSS